MTRTATLADLDALVGTELGASGWREVTQERIDTFADATDDHQWIHVDPERAATGPFGAPIAHGFLTLSLFIPLWGEIFALDGVETKVNYGLDKVRFTSPVKVGARVRLVATLARVEQIAGGVQLHVSGIIEIEGAERPAVVIEFIERDYLAK
ncbi:MaoC family dehydratase [Protaetiibacter mangrovi]|uniref:MaoC family dehydratase n=1 Tax=Protaetiibacter mangrovi TaxID=2970926 RepID=A0ABT1ZGL6_9MICO|nr:MaoC family dehydratase [Protaetiibacter mangrovi]MCS0499841.1 MaoC family dehydratase [Protaetiibacter mangrovi]TPX05558.1 MaoC family dehydratase [Schumannella luteola]